MAHIRRCLFMFIAMLVVLAVPVSGAFSATKITIQPLQSCAIDAPTTKDPSFHDLLRDRQFDIYDAACCKVCRKGKACGDSCIKKSYTCHKGKGCACDG